MRIGLTLSGGGIRGMAHIGVIAALREHDLEVDTYCGVSSGALVAVMAAANCSVGAMMSFWTETNPFSIFNLSIGKSFLYDTTEFIEPLRERVGKEHFEELPHTLMVGVCAMLKGEFQLIRSGKLWPIVLASSALPVVFSPVECNGEIYADGGLINNFPAELVNEEVDVSLGSDVTPFRPTSPQNLASLGGIVQRALDVRFNADRPAKDQYCQHIIIPDEIEQYGIFDTGKAQEIYELGYEAGQKAIPAIKRILEERREALDAGQELAT